MEQQRQQPTANYDVVDMEIDAPEPEMEQRVQQHPMSSDQPSTSNSAIPDAWRIANERLNQQVPIRPYPRKLVSTAEKSRLQYLEWIVEDPRRARLAAEVKAAGREKRKRRRKLEQQRSATTHQRNTQSTGASVQISPVRSGSQYGPWRNLDELIVDEFGRIHSESPIEPDYITLEVE